jgi:Domain of unknown function (DUF4062)
VFISSTLEELAEERAAALRAVRRWHLVPVWFESGARPHPPQSMYRAYLDQSQIFVGIYWQRYGWVGPGMEISGLEDEFRLAAGKPMLLYLKRPAPDRGFASGRADVTVTEELCRRAAEANERRAPPDWRVEEVICAARSNIAFTAGAFADPARLAEQAAGLARAGGDLADASIQLGTAVAGYLLVGDAPGAVPLAREALALARKIGAPTLIATALLAVGMTVVETDPEQARAYLREVSSSARRSAIKAPSMSGPPGSHFL